MFIGELSKKTGFSRDTIRFYEKLGAITPAFRRESRYREYTNEAVSTLLFIKSLKKVGFTLAEIKGWIELFKSESHTCETVMAKAEAKIHEVDEKIAQLQQIRKNLILAIKTCQRHSPHDLCETIEGIWVHPAK